MLLTWASAPSGSPLGRPSLRCRPAFSWSLSTSKPTFTRVTPSSADTLFTTAVWKWFLIGHPGVVSDTMTSTTPASLMSIARTISSSTMSLRSSGSITPFRASVICSRVGTSSLWQELFAIDVAGDPERQHDADAARVELVLVDPRLERRDLLRQQHVPVVAGGNVHLLAAGEDL